MSSERRVAIYEMLSETEHPIKGHILSEKFSVSRQVIVQDIAILRAKGHHVVASSKGYYIPSDISHKGIIKSFVSEHNGFEEMKRELETILEYGGKMIDVSVEHPVYGEITGHLIIESHQDLKEFLDEMETTKPLSILTGGKHRHTIEVPSETIYNLIMKKLEEQNLINLTEEDRSYF